MALNTQKLKIYSNIYSENNDVTDESIETYIGENEMKMSDIETEKLGEELEFGELAYVLKKYEKWKKPRTRRIYS